MTSMNAAHAASICCSIVIALAAPRAAWAQSAECANQPCSSTPNGTSSVAELWAHAARAHQFKLQFVAALREFTRAQVGAIGDEREALRASLDAMRQAIGRWDRAIADLETATAGMRRTADVHVVLATAYLDRQRAKDALRELAAAERLDRGRPDVYTLQAHAFAALGRAEEAARALDTAASLAPANPVIRYSLAHQWRRLGRSEPLEQALAAFPMLARAAGTAAPAAGEPFERVDLLRQSSGVAPVFPVGAYAEGFSALARGDYRGALSLFARAAERDPLARTAAAVRQKVTEAGAALRRADVPSALALLRGVVGSFPGEAEGQRMLGLAYGLDDQWDRSIEHYAIAVRLDANNERASTGLADALRAAGRTADAEQQLTASVSRFPMSGEARYRLGELLESQARYDAAVDAFEASRAFGPIVGKDRLLQIIGGIYVKQSRFDRAVAAYADRVDANPNNAEAHRQLAEIYFLDGRDVLALAEFEAARFIDATDARSHAGAGQVHLRMKRYDEAVASLSRAVTLGGADAPTLYALGQALARSGRDDAAKIHIDRSRDLQTRAIAAGQEEFRLRALRRDAEQSLADGKHIDAVAAFERLLELRALDPSVETHRHLAAAYTALGRAEDAARHTASADQLKTQQRLRRIQELTGAR